MLVVTALMSVCVASVLLVAGSSKLFSPRPLAKSMGELFKSQPQSPQLAALARCIGLCEVVAGASLAASTTARLGSLMAAFIGLGILAFVGLATLRHTEVECGCFGSVGGTRTLGLRNVLAGAILLASPLVLLRDRQLLDSLGMSVVLTLIVLGSLLLVFALNGSRLTSSMATAFGSS